MRLGYKKGRLMRQVDFRLFGLAHQYCHAGLQLWRVHGNGQAPAKTGLEPLFESAYFLGVAVAGENDLLAALEQGVECVKELFLGALLPGEKLDIINQERVRRPVVEFEVINGVELQRFDHVANEAFGVQVHNVGVAVPVCQLVAYSLHQVGFSQSDSPIEKQWVVG